MRVLDLGRQEYEDVWNLQKELVRQRIAGEIPDTLILVEHLPVFTVGRAAQVPTQIGDIPWVGVERGGGVTFHGPGQLVGYPIVDLRHRGRDVHRFLRELEELLIRTLADFSICAERCAGLTGVWVGAKKIASIGIALRHWVSYHGFALNVSTDLRYFQMISPCGLDGMVMTSMTEQLGKEVFMSEVKRSVLQHCREIFCDEYHVVNVAYVTSQY